MSFVQSHIDPALCITAATLFLAPIGNAVPGVNGELKEEEWKNRLRFPSHAIYPRKTIAAGKSAGAAATKTIEPLARFVAVRLRPAKEAFTEFPTDSADS
jgi:hypothetical protein